MILDRLRWWHLDQVVEIESDVFGPDRWTAAMFWNELANGHHYVAALEGDDLIGYAGLAVVKPEAWVNTIAVRRDRQHAGLGKQLLEHLLDHGRSRGVTQTLLEVAADNGPAQRLYDSYGFHTVGVRRGYYQPTNTDALVMRRDEP